MRCPLAVGIVLSFCSLVNAISYSDFPVSVQHVLDQRIADLQANGGVCVAGRVTFNDGTVIAGGQDVMVNFHDGVDEPLQIYANGWFTMIRGLSASYAGSGRQMVLRAFKYDPLDPSITVLSGAMTYVEFQMNRTPPANLADVTGTVTDEKGQPFSGAMVLLDYPFSYFITGSRPTQQLITSSSGQFSFSGLSIAQYSLTASADEYAHHYVAFTPTSGGITVQNRKLYPRRRVILDYVYQADGTLSFSGGNLQTGFMDWLDETGGANFSKGTTTRDSGNLEDLEVRQTQDVMQFYLYYTDGRNGFYDAGAVPFDSIGQASSSGYYGFFATCVVDHVYVVRTLLENHYAKFIVRSIERSFESVLPGDPAPISFSGYGLTVDLADVSAPGKLYVQLHPFSPPGLHAILPRYWDLSGMVGTSFRADVQLHYADDEVAALGLSEATLSIIASSDKGATWQVLPTSRDMVNNMLQVHDRTSLMWFAIGDTRDSDGDGVIDIVDACSNTLPGLPVDAVGCVIPVPGDFDGDRDVDQSDFGRFQLCLSGYGVAQNDPACANAQLNADSNVDQSDLSLFLKCLRGADVVVDPGCTN